VVALALAAFAVVATALREQVLRAAGWALVINDEPVAPADVIVLSIDSAGAGALEASDLVQSGVSKRVAVFQDPPSGEDNEFIRRGLPYEDAGARQIRQLKMLKVTDFTQISRVDGTESEGQMLPQWCDRQHLRSILVVASKDHSRRLRRVLDRDMEGHSTHVTVRAARYSSFDPDRWVGNSRRRPDRDCRISETLARRRTTNMNYTKRFYMAPEAPLFHPTRFWIS
jgi:hypothetical protein